MGRFPAKRRKHWTRINADEHGLFPDGRVESVYIRVKKVLGTNRRSLASGGRITMNGF
jgi:hypothetical protein